MALLIGIDIGTSATKTVVFNELGQTLASASCEYQVYQPQNGWNEQNPEDWWQAVVETLGRVLNSPGVVAKDIKGIGLSGQMHGLVMLDKDGEVLRPAIIWSDQRTAQECAELTAKIGAKRLIDITANPALPGFTASKILWVQKHEAEIFAHCKKILLPKDYIRFRLSGEYATEVSDASGMQLLNIGKRDWSPELLSALNLDRSMLASVSESKEVTAVVSKHAAALTGLQEGTAIVGGAGDNAAAAIGTGVATEGVAFTTIGSSGVVFAQTDELIVDPGGRVHSFCCAVPGAWHVMGVTQAAGLSFKWFKEEFCAAEVAAEESTGLSAYQALSDEAALRPIGANRLIYLPYLNGERTPHLDSNCRGVFFGLSSMHKKADLVRAILEGVSFSQLDSLSIMREMGIEFTDMRVTGGGATPFWQQMLSDVYNCQVSSLASSEGPALGVAILAGVGTGLYDSVQDACRELVQLKKTVQPVEQNHREYMKYYDIYKSLYPNLKDLWEDLSKI